METLSSRYAMALRESASWYDAVTIDELAGRVCDALLVLIPADGVGWNEICMPDGGLRVLARPHKYFPSHHERLGELIHESPLVAELARTKGRAHTFSDVISVREYHRRRIYNDVYRLYAVEDQLGAALQVDGGAIVALALNRGRRTFTRDDRQLLDLVSAHARAAYRTVVDRIAARTRLEAAERGLDADGKALLVLDANGRAAEASARGRRFLLDWFGGDVPAAGRYERPGAVLNVRRVDGEPPMLLLDERRTGPDTESLRALGLTRRELEVVGLAARGLTNESIARELFLSVRTVQKHLEHTYRKLGVRNRTGAARRLRDR